MVDKFNAVYLNVVNGNIMYYLLVCVMNSYNEKEIKSRIFSII